MGTAGVFVLLAGLGLASGGVGLGAAAAATPSVSATTRGPCPDVRPPSGDLVSATATSLTFSFMAYLPIPPEGCGPPAVTRLSVSTSSSGASSVDVTSAVGAATGTLTVTGLQPATDYWFWLGGGGSPFGAIRQGPVRTLPAVTPTAVPTTTRPFCPDGLPPSGQFVSATSTSLTFSFVVNAPAQPPGCGLSTATTVNVTDRNPDHPTVRVTGAPDLPSGTLTVTGLQPGTDYWFSFTGGGSPFGGASLGPVRTLTGAGPCTASYETISSWGTGFLGKITIRNTSATPLDRWKLAWTFTRGERLTGAYNATITGTTAGPILTPPSWMAAVPVGGSQAITILVADQPAPASLPVSCSVG